MTITHSHEHNPYHGSYQSSLLMVTSHKCERKIKSLMWWHEGPKMEDVRCLHTLCCAHSVGGKQYTLLYISVNCSHMAFQDSFQQYESVSYSRTATPNLSKCQLTPKRLKLLHGIKGFQWMCQALCFVVKLDVLLKVCGILSNIGIIKPLIVWVPTGQPCRATSLLPTCLSLDCLRHDSTNCLPWSFVKFVVLSAQPLNIDVWRFCSQNSATPQTFLFRLLDHGVALVLRIGWEKCSSPVVKGEGKERVIPLLLPSAPPQPRQSCRSKWRGKASSQHWPNILNMTQHVYHLSSISRNKATTIYPQMITSRSKNNGCSCVSSLWMMI